MRMLSLVGLVVCPILVEGARDQSATDAGTQDRMDWVVVRIETVRVGGRPCQLLVQGRGRADERVLDQLVDGGQGGSLGRVVWDRGFAGDERVGEEIGGG